MQLAVSTAGVTSIRVLTFSHPMLSPWLFRDTSSINETEFPQDPGIFKLPSMAAIKYPTHLRLFRKELVLPINYNSCNQWKGLKNNSNSQQRVALIWYVTISWSPDCLLALVSLIGSSRTIESLVTILMKERIAVCSIAWKDQQLILGKIVHLFWKKSDSLCNLRIIVVISLTVLTWVPLAR